MEQGNTTQPAVLAVQIRQHTHLPVGPTAFARITAWGRGQASADTAICSEWINAKPVLLAVNATGVRGGERDSAAIELEVSLWQKQQMGNSAEVSKVMLDAFGEVTLPAPQDLGTSEKQAVER